MRKSDCPRTSHKVVRKYEQDLYSAEPRKSLREIYDSMISGVGINAPIKLHKPLDPDGMNDDDFESGTREVLDLVDQQELERDIQTVLDKHAELQQKAAAEQHDAAFEQRVAEEVAKRMSDQQQ